MLRVDRKLEVFKECARHVWNVAFLREVHNFQEGAFRFDKIECELFDALVVRDLGIDWPGGRYKYGIVPGLFVQVKNLYQSLKVDVTLDILPGEGRVWKEKTILRSEFGALGFVSFFQWDSFGFSDLPFVECFDVQNNRFILIEHGKCEFYYLAEETLPRTPL
jgi:hypothetical protein